ncbi:MAG: MotA/TolQ/ExbB proton channel family protein [Verrucomicrobia bacterium]|nr:MAG: MotA/TolQ/ExbB proton channel family protein [Verrucomicrobiota bacterium]
MFELLRQGGPIMAVLLLVGIGAAAIFLERLFQLHRAQIRWRDFLQGLYVILRRGNVAEAVSLCEEAAGPVPMIIRAAILKHSEGPEKMRQAMQEVGLAEIPRIEKNMPLLATLAHIAPMLGLLGTILGLMQMLIAIQQRAPLVHAGDLAAGLWQALLLSAAGLVISIPAYAGYNLLVGRVESLTLDMERAAAEIMNFFAQNTVADAAKKEPKA